MRISYYYKINMEEYFEREPRIHFQHLLPCPYSRDFRLCPAEENPQKSNQSAARSFKQDCHSDKISLSVKRLTPSFEISFEKDFMKEHISVFRESYQNYIEFRRISAVSEGKKTSLASLETRTDLETLTVSSLLFQEKINLTPSEANQFLTDLAHQEKMHEFLNLVVREARPADSLKLVLVARKIWLFFIPFQEGDFSIQELIKISSEIAEKLTAAQGQDLFGSEFEGESKCNFLKVYCCTILLTIAEYFQNPFFNDERLKRPQTLGGRNPNIEDLFQPPPPLKKRK